MKRLVTVILVTVALLLAVPVLASAADAVLDPADVVAMGPELDGETIVIEGEAVGDVLRTVGGGKWVNVLGDEVGLGVWMDDDQVAQIEHLGNYQHSGDRIRVSGGLNTQCAQHGGEFDLHAERVEVVERGQPLEHEPRVVYALVGLVGMAVGGAFYARYRRLKWQGGP
jgi:hypothetical protein